MIRWLPVFALAAVACSGAKADLRVAQASSPPTTAEPAPKPAPAKKAQKAKPKEGGASASVTRKPDGDYAKTLQAPRRISREDLEDDPSAPAVSRVRPIVTPEGRAGLGGRF